MDTIDAKVFLGIAAATVAIVGSLKKAWPTWVKGKEDFLNIVIPVSFIIVAKIAGVFAETPWIDALIWAFIAGPAAGVGHDKFVNPLLKNRTTGGPK